MTDHIRSIIDFCMAISQEASIPANIRQLSSHIVATMGANNGGISLSLIYNNF